MLAVLAWLNWERTPPLEPLLTLLYALRRFIVIFKVFFARKKRQTSDLRGISHRKEMKMRVEMLII